MTIPPAGARQARPPRRRLLAAALFAIGVTLCAAAAVAAFASVRHFAGDSASSGRALATSSPTGTAGAGARSPRAPLDDALPLDQRPGADLAAPTGAAPPPAGGNVVRVPILMYHYVREVTNPADQLGRQLSVTPAQFNAQLDLLSANGFHTISMREVMDAVDHGRPLPSRPIVLTFDDGYSSFSAAAVPALEAHHMTATAYIVSGFLGRPGYMTPDEVRAAQDAGMTIGAHTIHHIDLARASGDTARLEIAGSRAALALLTGTSVSDFAYPYGSHSPSVDRLVADAGFRDAVTTAAGSVETAATRYTLPRVRVLGGGSLGDFAASVRASLDASPA